MHIYVPVSQLDQSKFYHNIAISYILSGVITKSSCIVHGATQRSCIMTNRCTNLVYLTIVYYVRMGLHIIASFLSSQHWILGQSQTGYINSSLRIIKPLQSLSVKLFTSYSYTLPSFKAEVVSEHFQIVAS